MLRVDCPNCGSHLRGPDDAAGKRIKCPKCGAAVSLPERGGSDAPPAGAFDLDEPNPYKAPEGDLARKTCPACGEKIPATAPKCPSCGEDFDPKAKKSKARKGGPGGGDMTTGDWAVAVLCSGIGCIAGIVWMIQGKPKGKKMLGVSLLMAVIWNVISFAVQYSLDKNR